MKKILKAVFTFFSLLQDAAVFLLFDLSELLLKYVVTVPSVSVTATPQSVDIGQSVTIAGIVNADVNTPAPAGTAVSIVVTDAAGNAQPAISTTTDATGAYTASFTVPTGFTAGVAKVAATALGVTGAATFTSN